MDINEKQKEYVQQIIKSLNNEYDRLMENVKNLKQDEYYSTHSADRDLAIDSLYETYNEEVFQDLDRAIDRGVDRNGLVEIAGCACVDNPEQTVDNRIAEMEYEEEFFNEELDTSSNKMLFELTGNSKEYDGHTVYQVRAIADIKLAPGVTAINEEDYKQKVIAKAGELGGWIEDENVFRGTNVWPGKDSIVYGDINIIGDANVILEGSIVKNSTINTSYTIIYQDEYEEHSREDGDITINIQNSYIVNSRIDVSSDSDRNGILPRISIKDSMIDNSSIEPTNDDAIISNSYITNNSIIGQSKITAATIVHSGINAFIGDNTEPAKVEPGSVIVNSELKGSIAVGKGAISVYTEINDYESTTVIPEHAVLNGFGRDFGRNYEELCEYKKGVTLVPANFDDGRNESIVIEAKRIQEEMYNEKTPKINIDIIYDAEMQIPPIEVHEESDEIILNSMTNSQTKSSNTKEYSKDVFKKILNRMEKESHKPTEKSAPIMNRDKGTEIGDD